MNNAIIATIQREILPDGKIKLSSPNGLIDIRNKQIYSEVICLPRLERFFIENIEEEEIK